MARKKNLLFAEALKDVNKFINEQKSSTSPCDLSETSSEEAKYGILFLNHLLKANKRSSENLTPQEKLLVQCIADFNVQCQVQDQEEPVSGCACKSGCKTRACGCRKKGTVCSAGCKCGEKCVNQPRDVEAQNDQEESCDDSSGSIDNGIDNGRENIDWQKHLSELVICVKCKRKFFPSRINYHMQVCKQN